MDFDPYTPYGPIVESTLRLVTWNVWGRYGEAGERQRQIDAELAELQPDLVCLTEAWAERDADQAQHVAPLLDHEHLRYFGVRPDTTAWTSGIAITSRWPIVEHSDHHLLDQSGKPRGLLAYVSIDGPRGNVQVFTVMLDYPLGASGVRQHQVRQMLEVVAAQANQRATTIVCGDFNAPPDSDEVRVLTGRCASPVDLVFYDAWEVAGDGGSGATFTRNNPLTAPNLFPDRRFDYILSAWPRAGGRGHPVHAQLVGRPQPAHAPASDHFGLLADLRY